jgi:hypothetical protein
VSPGEMLLRIIERGGPTPWVSEDDKKEIIWALNMGFIAVLIILLLGMVVGAYMVRAS